MAERITIKELVVKLLFEGSESGVTKFNQALGIFEKVAGYADRAINALASTVRSVTLDIADQADALDEAAQQVGVTASVYDALTASVQLNGATVGQLDVGLRTLTNTYTEFVQTGKGAGADAFRALLGPNARERLAEVKSVDEALGLVADGLAAVKDPAQQVALANEVLGRSGNKLLPTLKGGSAGLLEQAEAMRRIGTFSPALIAAGSRLNDGLAGLALRGRGLSLVFGEEAVPAMADLVEELNLTADSLRQVVDPAIRAGARLLADGIRQLRDWVRTLRTEVAQSERAVAVLRTGLIFLSSVVAILAVQLLPTLVLWLGRTTAAALRAGAAMLGAWARAAAPIVLLAALVTGLVLVIEDLYTFVTGGDSAFGRLLDRMRATSPALAEMAERLRYVFGGGIGEDLFDAFGRLSAWIASIGGSLLRFREYVSGLVSALPSWVTQPLFAPGRALGGSSRVNNVSVGGSSVSVAVNGAGNPRAVGAEVARQTDDAVRRHASRVVRDLGPVMQY